MLGQALKEWASICVALGQGRQAVLLRKGGIAETRGEFEVEHRRFWLYPTFLHQQQAEGLRPEGRPFLEQALARRPEPGNVRLELLAEVAEVYQVRDLAPLLLLAPFHFWSEKTVRSRFDYRHPGLHVLAVRVYHVLTPHTITETVHQAGCKSWVELESLLADEGAAPVMDDRAFADLLTTLDTVLRPPALA